MLCDDVPAVVADIDIVAAPLMNVGETRFEKETIVGDSPCPIIASKIAELRGVSMDEVAEVTTFAANTLFRLDR